MATLHLAIGTLTKPLLLILLGLRGLLHHYSLALLGLVLSIKAINLCIGYVTPGSAARRRYEVERQALQRKFDHIASPDYRLQELELQRQHGQPSSPGLVALLLGVLSALLSGYGYFGLWYVLICAPQLHDARLLWIPDMTAPDPYYVLPIGILLLFGGSIARSQRNRDPRHTYNWFLILLPPCWAGLNAFLPAGLCFYHLISFWMKPLVTLIFSVPFAVSAQLSRMRHGK